MAEREALSRERVDAFIEETINTMWIYRETGHKMYRETIAEALEKIHAEGYALGEQQARAAAAGLKCAVCEQPLEELVDKRLMHHDCMPWNE